MNYTYYRIVNKQNHLIWDCISNNIYEYSQLDDIDGEELQIRHLERYCIDTDLILQEFEFTTAELFNVLKDGTL